MKDKIAETLLQIDRSYYLHFTEEVAPILDKLLAFNQDLLVGAVRDSEEGRNYFNRLIIKIKILANRFDREIVSIEIPERLYLFLMLTTYSYTPIAQELIHIMGIPLKTSIDHYQITIELPCKEKLTRTCTPENNYIATYKFNPTY